MTRLAGLLLVALTVGLLMGGAEAQDTKKSKLDVDAIFKKLDTNNDGRLQRDEFLKMAERFKEKDKAREKLTMTFEKLDTDKKGLSIEQFRKYLESRTKKDAEK
jgi:Ca2+-binding EF-hand superfamily protein